MPHSQIQLGPNSKFERFLYAAVGEDGRGTSVTVLSMLARLGIDPWKEASDLTAMPEAAARQRLDKLMQRFTDVPFLIEARSEVVSRLHALLPGGAFSGTPGHGEKSAQVEPMAIWVPVHVIITAAILLVYLGIQAFGH